MKNPLLKNIEKMKTGELWAYWLHLFRMKFGKGTKLTTNQRIAVNEAYREVSNRVQNKN